MAKIKEFFMGQGLAVAESANGADFIVLFPKGVTEEHLDSMVIALDGWKAGFAKAKMQNIQKEEGQLKLNVADDPIGGEERATLIISKKANINNHEEKNFLKIFESQKIQFAILKFEMNELKNSLKAVSHELEEAKKGKAKAELALLQLKTVEEKLRGFVSGLADTNAIAEEAVKTANEAIEAALHPLIESAELEKEPKPKENAAQTKETMEVATQAPLAEEALDVSVSPEVSAEPKRTTKEVSPGQEPVTETKTETVATSTPTEATPPEAQTDMAKKEARRKELDDYGVDLLRWANTNKGLENKDGSITTMIEGRVVIDNKLEAGEIARAFGENTKDGTTNRGYLREAYDVNKDGRLSKEELERMVQIAKKANLTIDVEALGKVLDVDAEKKKSPITTPGAQNLSDSGTKR